MAADMARTNGDTHDIHDAATRIGILSQRTTNLETVVGDVRRELNQLGQTVNSSIGAMSSKVDERFNLIQATIAERSRPQWQALSVMLGVLVVLGGLVYWPIREQTQDLKTAVALVAEKMVVRDELDWRSARGAEDRKRTEDAIADLRARSVDRAEWLQQIHGRDQQVTELSRRIDEIRENLGNQYTTRDLLLQLQQEVNELRRRGEGVRTRFPSG